MTEKYFGFKPVVIEPGVKTGMPILTENPREVGADRIANSVAALDLFGGPVVVIDFGTATTYDAVSARGEYLGGAIAPGIEISLDALYTRAAALRRVELVEPRNIIGRTTVESIQSGAVYGFAGQVDGICRRLADELGGRRRGHRRPGQPHRAVHAVDPAHRAVAHTARPAPGVREEPIAHRPVGGGRWSAGWTTDRALTGHPWPTDRPSRTGSSPRHRRELHRAVRAQLEPGDGDRRRGHRRRPADAAPGPGEAGVRHAAGPDADASSCSPRPTSTPRLRRVHEASLGDWIGVTGKVMKTQEGRAVGARSTDWTCWPRRGGRSPTSGTASPTPTPATASATSTCGSPRRLAATFLLRSRLVSLTRRWLEDRGFVEVETPLLHPIPGGAHGQAVRHAPQRARHGPVPAHRARAVSQAARRRRLRAGLRDRPGVPQRGHRLPAATPSSRCSSCTRPTATTTT